jgi:hypothetical protein
MPVALWMRWRLAVPAVAVCALAGCSSGPAAVETALPPITLALSTAESDSSTSTITSSTATVGTETGEQGWSEIDAERQTINYLAALAAGAFEQAAWPTDDNGVVIEGQGVNETAAQALERLCAEDACKGPYVVRADGPGLIYPASGQASSTVTVTHVDSGRQGALKLGTFEGQLMVMGLPPLVPSAGAPSLVESLFGDDVPHRVVVARLDAFEIWDDGRSEWVTNWWADDTVQVEGDVLAGNEVLANIRDPQTTYDGLCVRLMSRDGEVLALDRCDTSSWGLFEVVSGEARVAPVPFEARGDGEYVWFAERGGTTVNGLGTPRGI